MFCRNKLLRKMSMFYIDEARRKRNYIQMYHIHDPQERFENEIRAYENCARRIKKLIK